MKDIAGYLIFFNKKFEKEVIPSFSKAKDKKDILSELSFSDSLSIDNWQRKEIQLSLLSFSSNTINYICLAEATRLVVTNKYRVEFSDLVDLHSLPMDKILKEYPEFDNLFTRDEENNNNIFTKDKWDKIILLIKKLVPSEEDEINRLLSLKKYSNYIFTGKNSELLMQEREAVGVALDIFSGANTLRKQVIKTWAPNEENIKEVENAKKLEAQINQNVEKPSSFLSGLSKKYLNEEDILQHDLLNWDGEQGEYNKDNYTCSFRQGGRTLDIIYSNRNDLEKTLGVDLIYYNYTYEAFILVQHKIMREKSRNENFVYRVDSQFEKELDRMNKFYKDNVDNKTLSSYKEYRLNDDGFLFKLIPNNPLEVGTDELKKGMFLTREYVNFLVSENGPKGEKGGKVITFKNSRYLTNSEFTNMVNKAWIGTKGVSSSKIREYITNYLNTGNAQIIALERK